MDINRKKLVLLVALISSFYFSSVNANVCQRPDNIFPQGQAAIDFLEEYNGLSYLGDCFIKIEVKDLCDIHDNYFATRLLINASNRQTHQYPSISVIIYPTKHLGDFLEVNNYKLEYMDKETRFLELPRYEELVVKKSNDGSLEELAIYNYKKYFFIRHYSLSLECSDNPH